MWTTVLYNVSQTLVNLALQNPMLEPRMTSSTDTFYDFTNFIWTEKEMGPQCQLCTLSLPHQTASTKPAHFMMALAVFKCTWLKNMTNKTSVAVCSLQFACANEDHLLLDSCLIDELKCDVANLIAQVLMWASGLRSSLYCLVTSGICLFHRLC